jgi:glycosyltransferase involved in cell wall biosynthesis
MGHNVTVLTVRQDPDHPHIEKRSGYSVVRFDPGITLLGNDISPGVAQYLSRADGFDVLHAHSHLYFSTNLVALRRALGGVPLAVTNHGLYSQTAPRWVFDLYLRTVGRWTFNQADIVFCYTETDGKRVRDFGVSAPIEIIPNGIDTEQFAPSVPESEMVGHEGPVILFVGRLVTGKQPRLAFEAVSNVRTRHPDAKLYFCGTGPLRGELEQAVAERGLDDAVTFLGEVPYQAMPRIYSSADVLVLLSEAEGVPRAILEAVSSGVPAVVTDLPQYSDIGYEGIRKVSPDPVVAGDEIVEILETANPNTDRQAIREKHQWKHTVAETTASLSSLCDEKERCSGFTGV